MLGSGDAPPVWSKVGRSVQLVLLLGFIFFFWEWKAFTPLRILVVFFHEASHALVAWLTGGQVTALVVNAREGGHVLAVGGNRFLTLNAGYLGSLLWGVAIFSTDSRSAHGNPSHSSTPASRWIGAGRSGQVRRDRRPARSTIVNVNRGCIRTWSMAPISRRKANVSV